MKIFKLCQRAVKYFENQEVYEDLVAKLLLFFIETLSPVKVCDGKKKCSKTFWFLAIVLTINALLSLTYAIIASRVLHFQVITELLAIFFCTIRIKIALGYVAVFHRYFVELVHRYIDERKSQQNQGAREITIKHYKNEFIAGSFFTFGPFILLFLLLTSIFLREFNENNLPILCYPILKLENHFVAWLINYIFQSVLAFSGAILAASIYPLVFFLMNNSCWQIDQTILLLKNLTEGDDCSEKIKSAVKGSYAVLRWLKDVQQRLQFFFFVEFTIMSVTLCMSFISVLTEPPGTVATFAMIFAQLSQFFVICRIGQRVLDRIDNLTDAIYDVKWYEMRVSDRKSIQLMLVMTQNLRGFNGIFNEVNMETFLTIVQFTYSLVMFFTSVR